MIIKDSVYGEYEFREKALTELIKSKPIQRLKKIAQYGVPDEWYHKKGYSRFEHSLGVTILLAKLNASLKEQIAGLLHDVSHTAFSHVIDWVYGDIKNEDFQDKMFFNVISSNQEIKEMLERYNFNLSDFQDLHSFSLLEQPLPNLCADRIDYCLRELEKEGKKEDVNICMNSLRVFNGMICFDSKKAAIIFRENYARLQKEHWAGDQAKNRYFILAGALKEAIKEKILDYEDFWKDDSYIVEKLKASTNELIKKNIAMLSTGNFEIMQLEKKNRFVEPYYIENNELKRLK